MVASNVHRGAPGNTDPGMAPFAIAKSDSTEQNARGLYVGGAGDVVVTNLNGTTVTFTGVVAGTILPIFAYKVMAATTASNIVGIDKA